VEVHKLPITFKGSVITGSGRGKTQTVPTINIDLRHVPDVNTGVYAALVEYRDATHFAAMHIGKRPTFNDNKSCEIHILDHVIDKAPDELQITVVKYIRPIKKFTDAAHLKITIKDDIQKIRAILSEHEINQKS